MTPHKVSRHLDPKGGPMRLVDYSTARPTPAQIRAAGYGGVMRYLSTYPPKNLSPAERDALLGAGLVIGLVWETTAARSAQGSAAGAADAQAAEAQADTLGYPSSCPVFYAVDFAATPGQVLPYFSGVLGAARRPVGVYGSASIIEAVPVPWKWQTVAWSSGRVSPQAHIYQSGAASLPGTDSNTVLRPLPLWGATPVAQVLAAWTPPTANIPAPTLAPPAPAHTQEDDMPTIYDAPGRGLWLADGPGPLVGLSTTAEADALTAKGILRVPVTAAVLDEMRANRLGVELLFSSNGFAVGHPGSRYIPLGQQSEVDHWKSLGAVQRNVDVETFTNLTAA